MAEGFACVNVGKMNFNEGQPNRGKGIAQRNTGMGKRCRIDHNKPRAVGAGLLHPVAAAILMPLSSLTVVSSSYRARPFPDA